MFLLIFLVSTYCGVNALPTSRIHGGIDAPPGFAPHMVALLAGDRAHVVCGGSIVTERHVLTAAHCITPHVEGGVLVSTFHGRVGSNIWHSGGLLINFQHHSIHPHWDEDIIKNDVGILTLARSLVFNEMVGKIGLNFDWVGEGEEMFVTGWGTTEWRIIGDAVHLAPTPDELQLLYVRSLSPRDCEHRILSSPQWAHIAPPMNHTVEMCALHASGLGHGMCHGDSGSGLVSLHGGEQHGIVSYGFPCARGLPDVFTRLAGVEDWVLAELGLQL